METNVIDHHKPEKNKNRGKNKITFDKFCRYVITQKKRAKDFDCKLFVKHFHQRIGIFVLFVHEKIPYVLTFINARQNSNWISITHISLPSFIQVIQTR